MIWALLPPFAICGILQDDFSFFAFVVLCVDCSVEEHPTSLFRIVGLELRYNLVTPVGYKEGGHNQNWGGIVNL